MEVERGAIVLAAGPGDYSGKPRPFLVVQSDLFNASHNSFTLCPMTSRTTSNSLFRISIAPEPDTGLREESEVQVDKVQSLRRDRIVRVIGRIPATAIEHVDQALRRWLAL